MGRMGTFTSLIFQAGRVFFRDGSICFGRGRLLGEEEGFWTVVNGGVIFRGRGHFVGHRFLGRF